MNQRWIAMIGLAAAVGMAILFSNRVHHPAPVSSQSAVESEFTNHDPAFPDPAAVADAAQFIEPSVRDRIARLSVAIWNELNSSVEEAHDIVFTNLLPELIALDPLSAARLIEATSSEQSREELLRQLVQTWVTNDTAAALKWAGQLTDTNEQRRVLLYATLQIADTDPSAAAATATRYQLGEGDGAILESIALSWAAKDLSAAFTWAAGQPAGRRRDDMMARIAFVESRTAPEAAARLVIQEIPPGSAQAEAAISVLHQWALRDFVSANEWADRFPPGPLRERALKELSSLQTMASYAE